MTPSEARAKMAELKAEKLDWAEKRYGFVAEQDFENASKCRQEEDRLANEIFEIMMEWCI